MTTAQATPQAEAAATRLQANLAAANDPDALLQVSTVQALTGLSRATIYRWIKTKGFPKPVNLGPGCVRWKAGTVREWMQKRGEE